MSSIHQYLSTYLIFEDLLLPYLTLLKLDENWDKLEHIYKVSLKNCKASNLTVIWVKKTIILMTKNKANYTLLLGKETEKYVCSAFECLPGINSILTFLFPNERETPFNSFKYSFWVIDLKVPVQITTKPKLFFLQFCKMSKAQIVQEGQTCRYIKCFFVDLYTLST